MTKYYYSCKEDKRLIEKSFYNIAYIIFGKKNVDKINTLREFWEEMVSDVNVFPQGSVHDRINCNTPGVCRLDKETKKLKIEMLGYKGANNTQSSWIKHEGTHEFCHSFVDLLPQIMSEHEGGIIKNGILCENHMGMIKETNPLTGELVGHHYYGKMYNETMMDIISSIAINYFDSSSNLKTVNDILNKHYNDWGNEKTGYSIFTSLTRLTIAAFSNVANPDYDAVIRSGYGIFDVKKKLKNGEMQYANDFLYGIIYDPLHIEEEFDKFMGNGYYRTFCEYLDKLFLTALDNQKLPSDDVKRVMNILPDFLNKKMNFYLKNNLMDLDVANQIVSTFNRIWNSMQKEYGAYFSQKDIDDIAKRDGRKLELLKDEDKSSN